MQFKVPTLESKEGKQQSKRTKSNMKAPKLNVNKVELIPRQSGSQAKEEPINEELFAEFSGIGKTFLTHTKS